MYPLSRQLSCQSCVILSQRQEPKNEPKEPVAKKRRRHKEGIPQVHANHQVEPRADSAVCLGALRGTTIALCKDPSTRHLDG